MQETEEIKNKKKLPIISKSVPTVPLRLPLKLETYFLQQLVCQETILLQIGKIQNYIPK